MGRRAVHDEVNGNPSVERPHTSAGRGPWAEGRRRADRSHRLDRVDRDLSARKHLFVEGALGEALARGGARRGRCSRPSPGPRPSVRAHALRDVEGARERPVVVAHERADPPSKTKDGRGPGLGRERVLQRAPPRCASASPSAPRRRGARGADGSRSTRSRRCERSARRSPRPGPPAGGEPFAEVAVRFTVNGTTSHATPPRLSRGQPRAMPVVGFVGTWNLTAVGVTLPTVGS